MAIVAGFGNPLLDITIKIHDDKLLQKYNLKIDDQSQIKENEMKNLLQDIKDFSSAHTLGGSVLNTLRVFQWLNSNNNSCSYMIGAIGNDYEGKCLKSLAEEDGVETLFAISQEKSTGVSVALVQNETRCLVAYVGAAETFSIKNLEQITQNWKLIENASVFYIEGFFLTDRHEVTKHIMQWTRSEKKLLMYNMSAPYISQENSSMVKYIIENCDILIGNTNEFKAYLDIHEPNSTPLDYALKLNKSFLQQTNFKYRKMILITDGPNPITCIYGDNEKIIVSTEKLSTEKIKDTTGAGDAFAAGFISGLFKDFPPDKCIKYGSWAALQIIQQVGCKIPDYSPDFN
ncbi:adenosine kinase-like [Onthophagus taurus]|uniref:adenosine kinase-like n=1 Tax=Onthophagus taurus TaxID=166361 RepID=UPI000C2001D3|nr:adenosine kinase-like [Onthophagus taurus]XP_022911809.1 adenosine kinase-like [Onthophagus taurus]XP_022911810.1 adenosine kinase-like [Onthophagus taurus]